MTTEVLRGSFSVKLVYVVTLLHCGSTVPVDYAACTFPPPGPAGPLGAMMPLPRVVSHPAASRTAGALHMGSLSLVYPTASGWASIPGLGRQPSAAGLALLCRAAGAAAHDFGTLPRAVGTRLSTCTRIEVIVITCRLTASAQASSPRSRQGRRTRRRMR